FHGVQVRNEAVDTTRAELVEPVRADDARADRDESDAPALQRRAVSEHPLEHFGLGAEALVALAPTLGLDVPRAGGTELRARVDQEPLEQGRGAFCVDAEQGAGPGLTEGHIAVGDDALRIVEVRPHRLRELARKRARPALVDLRQYRGHHERAEPRTEAVLVDAEAEGRRHGGAMLAT